MALIQPKLKDADFLRDVEAAPREEKSFCLWWLGQSGYLIAWNGHHLILDPYLSDTLTDKYAATDKPHIRMSERVDDPQNLKLPDVVITSSHNHTDHLDAATLVPLLGVDGAQFVIPEANREFIADRLKCTPEMPIGMNDGVNKQVGAFHFTGIAAAHESLEVDDAGNHKYLGYVVKFGPFAIYHSGDTVLYDGMVERLKPHKVDLALLPINGALPERRVSGNLNGAEAAQLAKAIDARLAIPCHYDMFTFNTDSPDEFVKTAEQIHQPVRVLELGERWSSTQLP